MNDSSARLHNAEPGRRRFGPPEIASSKELKGSASELARRFVGLQSARDLAELLDVPYSHLMYLAYRARDEELYTTFSIRSRSGRVREVSAPRASLKIVQRKIARLLNEFLRDSKIAHGYVPGRSVATNVLPHCSKRYVFSIDFENFFSSIHFGRVRGIFEEKTFGHSREVATALANLCCHRKVLPQGAPTSPPLSNLVCRSLDRDLRRLAHMSGCEVSRYADDLTFSTNRSDFPSLIALGTGSIARPRPSTELQELIKKHGFALNEQKTRLTGRSRRQVVTGIVVNKVPRPPIAFRKRAEVAIFLWRKLGVEAAEAFARKEAASRHRRPGRELPTLAKWLEGGLRYWSMVSGSNDPEFRRAFRAYRRIVPETRLLRRHLELVERIRGAIVVVESEVEGEATQGTGFLLQGYGLITCDHVVGDRVELKRSDGTTIAAARVGARSPAHDIALLDADAGEIRGLAADFTWRAEVGRPIVVAGFPEFRPGDSGYVTEGRVAGFRRVSMSDRFLVGGGAFIVAGQSGGPVLNSRGAVIGIAVSGAERLGEAAKTERHGVVPIGLVANLSRTAVG